jgi:hypothetical protein
VRSLVWFLDVIVMENIELLTKFMLWCEEKRKQIIRRIISGIKQIQRDGKWTRHIQCRGFMPIPSVKNLTSSVVQRMSPLEFKPVAE